MKTLVFFSIKSHFLCSPLRSFCSAHALFNRFMEASQIDILKMLFTQPFISYIFKSSDLYPIRLPLSFSTPDNCLHYENHLYQSIPHLPLPWDFPSPIYPLIYRIPHPPSYLLPYTIQPTNHLQKSYPDPLLSSHLSSPRPPR